MKSQNSIYLARDRHARCICQPASPLPNRYLFSTIRTFNSIGDSMVSNRPNILYVHSHDTGRYVQPYGFAVPTPNIQKLAEQGILFRQAFCAGPTCSPSRAALLTGAYPHCVGMMGLAHKNWSLNDYGQHVLHTLRAAGYSSTLIGFEHVIDWPKADRIGYDEVVQPIAEAHADVIVPKACDFLGKVDRNKPFFLSVGMIETHRFGTAQHFSRSGRKGDPRYCRPPIPIPDTPETRADMADFVDAAGVLDTGIGRILGKLDAQGLAENTLVICTTDHGIAFPSMKCSLTVHGIGVMLIMRGPGGFTGGRVINALVSHVDLFPTICDMAGVSHPAWLQGHSLVPVVSGNAEQVRDHVYAEVNWHVEYEPQRAVRDRRWSYIRHFGEDRRPIKENCDPSSSRDLWVANGWTDRPHDRDRLYDLIFDPHEMHNVAGDPAYAQVLRKMQGHLEHWMRETGDPLLKGDT